MRQKMADGNTKSRIENATFSPERAVENTLASIDRARKEPLGVQSLPGGASKGLVAWKKELIVIVGMTSNGKTSLGSYIAHQHAMHIQRKNRENLAHPHIVVWVTWEDTIESFTIKNFSRITKISPSKMARGDITDADFDILVKQAAPKVREMPIWAIGSSSEDDRSSHRLGMREINLALQAIENSGIVIDLIMLDYFQRIPFEGSDPTVGYMRVADDAKSMTLRCPVVLFSQVDRSVAKRTIPMPGLADGQWSSNLEHSADHFWGIWMPKQQIEINKFVPYGGKDIKYKVTEDLLLLAVQKQKDGPAPIHLAFHMAVGGTDLWEATPEVK